LDSKLFAASGHLLLRMKDRYLAYILTFFATFLFVSNIAAQRNVTPAIDRDPVMEQDAKHNLEVARTAFTLKKAYKGVLMRFEETYAAYPEFSRIDEFLYLAGMSSYYLSENKGKQKIDLKLEKDPNKYAPAKLREDAIAYLSTIVEKYPQSQYKDEAEKTLKLIQTEK
jgi:outer membrane protein assembly factor BamD (BamD/ComL family)